MAPPSLLAPSTRPFPDDLRIPSTSPGLSKAFSKFSRSSLLSVALQWLAPKNQPSCSPFLSAGLGEGDDDDDWSYPPAERLEGLRETYEELQNRKGSKLEVVDRILEGDWRHGLSLRQLAMLDIQYLFDHPSSLQWTALRLNQITTKGLVPSKKLKPGQSPVPPFHVATFLRNLQSEISPLAKAHFHIHRPDESLQLPMVLLRVYVTDSPYSNPRSKTTFTNSSKVVFIVFPDSCPYVYISLCSPIFEKHSKTFQTTPAGARTLKKLVVDAIPKALSHQNNRYKLQTVSFGAKSLRAMLDFYGPGRKNNAQGVFSIFADGILEESPLDPVPRSPEDERNQNEKRFNAVEKENEPPPPTPESNQVTASQKPTSRAIRKRPVSQLASSNALPDPATLKRRKIAATRFGSSAANPSDGIGLYRFEVGLKDPIPSYHSVNLDPVQSYCSEPISPQPRSRPRQQNLLDSYTGSPVSISNLLDPSEDKMRPEIRVTFAGTHVFAGIRALVEKGVIDGEKMPRWMTGEESVSVGVIKNGKMVGRS